jgi:hypothetical protein
MAYLYYAIWGESTLQWAKNVVTNYTIFQKSSVTFKFQLPPS